MKDENSQKGVQAVSFGMPHFGIVAVRSQAVSQSFEYSHFFGITNNGGFLAIATFVGDKEIQDQTHFG